MLICMYVCMYIYAHTTNSAHDGSEFPFAFLALAGHCKPVAQGVYLFVSTRLSAYVCLAHIGQGLVDR